MRFVYSISLCAAIALLCSSPLARAQAPVHAQTRPLKDRIPPANPNKYRSIRDAQYWKNPFLIVEADGIDAWPISAKVPRMTLANVIPYLEKLPSTALPYGLVVGVAENGVRAPGNDERYTRNREELVHLLREAGVQVTLWPSG